MRHGMLTWDDVLAKLCEMSPDRLQDTATFHVEGSDEFFGVTKFGKSSSGDPADGILDDGHEYLQGGEV